MRLVAAVAALLAACVHLPPALSSVALEGPVDDATVGALIEAAARARGLKLRRKVEWRIVPPEGLEKAMADAEAHAAERGSRAEAGLPLLLRAMGLVGTGWSAKGDTRALVRDQLYGWYDPLRKLMHVLDRPVAQMLPGMSVPAGLALRAAIIHEAAHAVQDQNFDLSGVLDAASDLDALLAARALAEGDATLVMMDALRELAGGGPDPVPGERAVRDAYAAGGPAIAESLGGLSPFPREALLLAYLDGTVFAAALRRIGGTALLDEAWRRPPRSTAQVLHPELYVRGVQPDAIGDIHSEAVEKAGYSVAATGTAGELACDAYLGEGVRVAAGWRGDRYAVLRGPPRAAGGGPGSDDVVEPALVWITTWATPDDAGRFADAAWERAQAECSVEERCDAGVPVWVESREEVAVLVRGLPPDLEDAAVADAFAVSWRRPAPEPIAGWSWTEEPPPEPYADLATRSRLAPARVLADRLEMPALGIELDLPPGEWKIHTGAPPQFSQAFAGPGGGLVAAALLPAAAGAPLGAFADGVARGASQGGKLKLVRSEGRTVSGRPAVEKELRPSEGGGPSVHVLAFARNGWIVTLVGVASPGLHRAQAEAFRRAVTEPRVAPLRDTRELVGGVR